jgi:hypothetical protein
VRKRKDLAEANLVVDSKEMEATRTARMEVLFTRKKGPKRHIFIIVSSKQASEFDLVSQFIINHIRKEYEDSNNVGDALEDRKEVDFSQFKPGLQFSQDQDQITRDKEDQENEKIFEAQV